MPDNHRKHFRIIDGRKLDSLAIDPNVSLALTAKREIGFSSSFSGNTVRPVLGGTHGYLSEFHEIRTGFVGYGAGIEQGVTIPEWTFRMLLLLLLGY